MIIIKVYSKVKNCVKHEIWSDQIESVKKLNGDPLTLFKIIEINLKSNLIKTYETVIFLNQPLSN